MRSARNRGGAAESKTASPNPTTATAGPARRAALADSIRRTGVTLVEDDGHAALLDPGLAPIAAQVPERAYYVAGLSKSVSPGLRTAYVAAPAGVAVTPASAFATSSARPAAGVRVCLGAAHSHAQLAEAVRALAMARAEEPAAIRAYF